MAILQHFKLFSSDLSSQSDEKVFVKMEMKMKNLLLDWLGKQTGMIYVRYTIYSHVSVKARVYLQVNLHYIQVSSTAPLV